MCKSNKNLLTFSSFATENKKSLFSWGAGLQGQLGLGSEILAQSLPQEIQEIPAEEGFHSIAASSDISALITETGKIYTWGKTKVPSQKPPNSYQGMGLGERGFTANLTLPTQFTELDEHEFSQISCGRTHFGAVTKDGRL